MENRLPESEQPIWLDCAKGDNWFDFLRLLKHFIMVPARKGASRGYEGCNRLGDLVFPISIEQVQLLEDTDLSSRTLNLYDFPLWSFAAVS